MPKHKIVKANQRMAAITLRGNLCIAQSIPSYLVTGSINDLAGSNRPLAEVNLQPTKASTAGEALHNEDLLQFFRDAYFS